MKTKAQPRLKRPRPRNTHTHTARELAKRAQRGQKKVAELTEQRLRQADGLNESLKHHGLD